MAKMLDEVQETVLRNGLKVITKEVPTSPAVSSWIWYRAGSRNEYSGITGISHWVEHMLFKGTRKYGKGKIDILLSKHGGSFNAFTGEDHTTYFETLPARHMDLGLRMEADRMQNALFDPRETESERTVVISEREGAENQPAYLLYEEVISAAFRVHPYHNPIVGWMSDLRTMTREDLLSYYRTMYVPSNAFLVVAGRFDTGKILERIEELYGTIPRGEPDRRPIPEEPPQHGERRVVVSRPGNTEYLIVAYHVPSMSHEDTLPLMMLDAVMSGAKAVRSGPSFVRSGRLYKSLVQSQLATSAYSTYQESVDPNLYTFFITARNRVPVEKVERALLKEIDRIRSKPPTKKEMKRAASQTEAQFAYATDGITGMAYLLGSAELRVGYHHLEDLTERLMAVEREEVQRVAEAYLSEGNRTVGIFRPTEGVQ